MSKKNAVRTPAGIACVVCGTDDNHITNPCEFMASVRTHISLLHAKGEHSACHPSRCIKTKRVIV